MLGEIKHIEEKSNDLLEAFRQTLIDLHDTVQLKTIIPANLVYPYFSKLGHIWHKMQDQVIFLSKINQITGNLQLYMKQVTLMDDVLKEMVGDNPILTDAERLDTDAMYRVAQLECNRLILSPSQITDFDKVSLEYLGFCAWKLVESEGALIPGNPNLGVATINNRYYVFSCEEALQAFMKSPEKYINKTLHVMRNKLELIRFLKLYEQLEEVKTVTELVPIEVEVHVTHEISTETELHPVSSKIDPNYQWNVWELKRQAIRLADMSKRQTHSVQTDKSNNKCAVRTQTHEMRDKIHQTKKDNYTNVPTLSNFIYGLRGRKDDKQFIITLTRPVEEK